MPRKYNDMYLDLKKELRQTGDANPQLTARELICAATDKTKEQLAASMQMYITGENEDLIFTWLERRKLGEPLAHIIGEWDFMGRTFLVSPDVLIPRDDTEIVTQLAILEAEKLEKPSILDLCCGSGCIGITVALSVPQSRLAMVDISEKALYICRKNISRHLVSTRAVTLAANVLEEAPLAFGTFDVIVSNPPYIKTSELETLDRDVKDYEPMMALDGGEDGLEFYRRIAGGWKQALKEGGKLIFEVGIDQCMPVAVILQDCGYNVLGVARDLQGIDRAILAELDNKTLG